MERNAVAPNGPSCRAAVRRGARRHKTADPAIIIGFDVDRRGRVVFDASMPLSGFINLSPLIRPLLRFKIKRRNLTANDLSRLRGVRPAEQAHSLGVFSRSGGRINI
jgi:hypothetical protein